VATKGQDVNVVTILHATDLGTLVLLLCWGKSSFAACFGTASASYTYLSEKRGGTGARGVAAYRRSGDGDTVQLQFKLQPQLLTITPFQLHWGADVTTLKK